MILYFAYGSNLDCGQMRARCPSAQFVCCAVLKDHVLAFTRDSLKRGCGVADVIPQMGHDVWGVIYQIEDQDLAALDKSEGYRPGRDPERNSYNRDDNVRVVAEDEERQPMRVSTYFAVKQPGPHRPSRAYMRQIIDGAESWNLPPDYIAELEHVEAAP